tara:strand:- start:1145 stop:1384 length:240 start_codon:yes stop_codon:yes gene_type:complete
MAYWALINSADDGEYVADIVTTDPGNAPGKWVKCTKSTKAFDKYSSSTKKFTAYTYTMPTPTLGEDVIANGEGYLLPKE